MAAYDVAETRVLVYDEADRRSTMWNVTGQYVPRFVTTEASWSAPDVGA